MKTLMLITNNKITNEVISKLIIDNFPFSKKITRNDEIELFIGKYPREFYIIFSDSQLFKDDPLLSTFEEDDVKQFLDKNSYINTLYYRNNDVAKNVVKSILEKYPELYIFDEDKDCFTSGYDFVK